MNVLHWAYTELVLEKNNNFSFSLSLSICINLLILAFCCVSNKYSNTHYKIINHYFVRRYFYFMSKKCSYSLLHKYGLWFQRGEKLIEQEKPVYWRPWKSGSMKICQKLVFNQNSLSTSYTNNSISFILTA